jgi:hypothetical protein
MDTPMILMVMAFLMVVSMAGLAGRGAEQSPRKAQDRDLMSCRDMPNQRSSVCHACRFPGDADNAAQDGQALDAK